ncbi:MAG TPA: DUF6580 family putative transport protein [Puia sp.]|jgi:hypothetical protein|nr:DUF6580 family putative transport protein [Puia sp.]
MKSSNKIIWSFLLLVIIAALYRIIPGRPYGFAPQWAMAVFAGAVIKDKKWAFLIPVLSMFISDLLYQVLYIGGLTNMQGFYEGQWQNYVLFTLLVFVGIAIRKMNVLQIVAASLAAPSLYFIVSNFLVWASNGTTRGLDRPKTIKGLMLCYSDGIPFYITSILATLVFSAILFGTYAFIRNYRAVGKEIKAS